MIDICFIILHYVALIETIACVESIKKMNDQEKIRIVIVDNASPNNSGKELAERYRNDEQVHVICNVENVGFSRGNNIGWEYVRDKWNPMYCVVTNNDVVFTQENFTDLVRKEYEISHFAVLGMDIYNNRLHIHQSPIGINVPGILTINKTIILNAIMLKTMFVTYPIMRWYYERLEHIGKNSQNYDKYQRNVCLMGACLVFSEQYLKKREYIFWPETKFYYEEYLLSLWCMRNQELVIYSPEIKVLHNEGVATRCAHKEKQRRIIFRMKNILDSAKIYKRVLSMKEDL